MPGVMEFPTIASASRAIAAGQVSPVELVQACLDRIARHDGPLHSFIRTTPERALADAQASAARWRAGIQLGPLDGIPIAHKDIYETAGIPTTAHSRLLQDWVPAADGTVVRLWRDAGTAMLGKLANARVRLRRPVLRPALAAGAQPVGHHPLHGGQQQRNGGGCGGRLHPGGHGVGHRRLHTRPGGAVRHCGDQADLRPVQPHGHPAAGLVDGPCGADGLDGGGLRHAPASHGRPGPGGPGQRRAAGAGPARDCHPGGERACASASCLRAWHEQEQPVTPATLAGIEAAADLFRQAGAAVQDVALPSLADFYACGWLIMVTEAFAAHEPWLRTRFNDYGELLRDRMAMGGLVSAADYVQAVRRRRELCAAVHAAMRDVDLLLTASATSTGRPLYSPVSSFSQPKAKGSVLSTVPSGLNVVTMTRAPTGAVRFQEPCWALKMAPRYCSGNILPR